MPSTSSAACDSSALASSAGGATHKGSWAAGLRTLNVGQQEEDEDEDALLLRAPEEMFIDVQIEMDNDDAPLAHVNI